MLSTIKRTDCSVPLKIAELLLSLCYLSSLWFGGAFFFGGLHLIFFRWGSEWKSVQCPVHEDLNILKERLEFLLFCGHFHKTFYILPYSIGMEVEGKEFLFPLRTDAHYHGRYGLFLSCHTIQFFYCEQYRLSIESKFVSAGSGTTLLLHPKSESSGML